MICLLNRLNPNTEVALIILTSLNPMQVQERLFASLQTMAKLKKKNLRSSARSITDFKITERLTLRTEKHC